jgi:hypothetical protein
MKNNVKYLKWYWAICLSRKTMDRNKGDGNYYERHHIVPKWMGGSNDKSNLVLLTAREHYLCHYLLFLSYKDRPSSAAFHKMNNTINSDHRDSKKYAELREYQSNAWCGKNNPSKREDVRKKISDKVSGKGNGMYGRTGKSNPFYGKTHTEDFKEYKKKLHGKPTIFRGVTYHSLRDAERQTGISRFKITKEINEKQHSNS